VTGQLLGLEIGDELHVTDSFPLPTNRGEEEVEDTSEKHARDMLKILSDNNVDINTIGWYQSTFLGIHISKFLVDTQFGYQSSTPESVFITYDSLVASHGSVGLRAFRLTDAFMKLRKDNTFTKDKLTELKFTFLDIFEEVPILVTSGLLSQGFLASLSNDPQIQNQFENFERSSQEYMQNNMEVISYCLSDMQKEQGNYGIWFRNASKQAQLQEAYIQNRKSQNAARVEAGEAPLPEDVKELEIESPSTFRKPVEPSQLETLLISYKISTHCDQIIQFAGKSVTNQYAVQGLAEM